MSRSYRKVAKFPVCCVGHKGIKKWKENSRRGRRAREKEQMNGIVVDEEGYDEETCTVVPMTGLVRMTDGIRMVQRLLNVTLRNGTISPNTSRIWNLPKMK